MAIKFYILANTISIITSFFQIDTISRITFPCPNLNRLICPACILIIQPYFEQTRLALHWLCLLFEMRLFRISPVVPNLAEKITMAQ